MSVARRDFLKQAGAAAGVLGVVSSAHGAPSAARIKIGQIGTRHAHASGKLATIKKLDSHYELVGVVEPDAARRRALQNDPVYQGVRWLDEKQLLSTPGLKAVAVETEVAQLVPAAQRCVAAGMHVHLDKPAGESLSPFRQLLADAERRSVVVQMGYMLRYNPAFQFLQRAVRQQWLGNIFEVHAVMSKTVNDATRRELAKYPGGAMFELGCHLIDALVATLGPPNNVVPYTRRTRGGRTERPDQLADNQLAVFEYKTATATVRSALVEVDGFRRRQFVVCGDRGTIEIRPLEPPQLTLTLAEPRDKFVRGSQTVPLTPLGGRYDGDFLDLAAIVRGQKAPRFTAEHDLAVQEAVLRASGLRAG